MGLCVMCMFVVNDIDSGFCVMKKKKYKKVIRVGNC